jgi:hypothetical protein
MTRYLFSGALLAAVLLSGCGESKAPVAEQKKEEEKPPEPVSGNTAFFRMYTAARGWAPDVEPLRLVSLPLEGVPQEPGKAGAWQATFISRSSGRQRSYTYAVIQGPGSLYKGVFAGHEESYTQRRDIQPFMIQALKVDSTTAYQTAIEQGSRVKDYMAKNPDMNISFILEQTREFNLPAWRVLWGDSPTTSNYSIYIDAASGSYLKTAR